jgi:SAM-dependent methyltransferase
VYSTDLAYIHDAGFSDFARRAAPELIRLLRGHGIGRSRVSQRAPTIVEVGCGSGILARHLVDAGYDVIGVDASPAMIRLARARVPEARFRVASLSVTRIPPCDAVIAIGEVVSCVSRFAAVRRFFNAAGRAVKGNGLFLFDFMESAVGRTYPPKSRGGHDWAIVAQADVDRAGRVLTRRLTMFRKVRGEYRRSREIHRLRLHHRRQVATALTAAGFVADMRRSYGACRLLAGDVAVIARRRR